ncbi:DcrB-related protein [Pseudomonas sp. X10]
MANYLTQDLTLDLGDETPEDTTMNMLVFRQRGTTLVIARSPLPPEQSLAAVYSQQLEHIRTHLGGIASEPQPVTAGQARNIQGLEISLQLRRADQLTHQRQLAYQPPGEQRLVVMSYSKNSPLGDADLAHWQAIKAGLRLN